MCCARELALAGYQVLLLERGRLGRQASAAAGGILCPLEPWKMPASVRAQVRRSQQLYPAFAEQLRQESGVDPGWRRCGLLMPCSPGKEQARAWAAYGGTRLEWIDAARARQLQPGLGAVTAPCLWLPEVARVDPRRLLRALRRSLRHLGVVVRQGEEVRRLQRRHHMIEVVRTSSGSYTCGAVIIAAGAWSCQLLNGMAPMPALRPVRGQMIAYRDRSCRLRRMLLDQGHYLVPRPGGLIVVGSTLEAVGFDTGVTEAAREELQAAAVRLMPALARLPQRAHWSGLRPASMDGLPFLGRVPDLTNAYLNTGHYCNGILLAPVSAQLIVDFLLRGQEPPQELHPARGLQPEGALWTFGQQASEALERLLSASQR